VFDEVVDGAECVGLDDVERARVVRFAADAVVADVDVARRAWLVVSHRQHVRPAVCIVHTHTHTHSLSYSYNNYTHYSRVVSVLDSGAEGPGFKSQSRRCRVTVLGKLFTPIVPLFAKQRNW